MAVFDWFTAALVVAAAAYVLLAAAIVAGRTQYDRRRRLFERIATAVEACAARPDAPGPRLDLSRLLRGSSVRALERAVTEAAASDAVLHACAEHVLARVGSAHLVARAAGPTRRWRRIAALRTLAFAGADAAWPLLDRALGDRDLEVVRAAAVTLGQLGGRRSADLLVKALREGRHVRSATAVLLDARAEDIGALLPPLLADRDPVVRYWGAVLAGRYPSMAGTEMRLIALADDADPRVRKAALDSLAIAGSAAAVPTVLARLDDPVPFVRAHAARAVGELAGVAAAAMLARRLDDRDWWTRDAVKRTLETIGGGVEPAVLGYLWSEDLFARNGAAEVLQHLGTFERLLIEEATGPSDARRLALLEQLADAGGRRVWDVVIADLAGRPWIVAATLDRLARRAAASTEALTA